MYNLDKGVYNKDNELCGYRDNKERDEYNRAVERRHYSFANMR